jgi:hypothetical protein
MLTHSRLRLALLLGSAAIAGAHSALFRPRYNIFTTNYSEKRIAYTMDNLISYPFDILWDQWIFSKAKADVQFHVEKQVEGMGSTTAEQRRGSLCRMGGTYR